MCTEAEQGAHEPDLGGDKDMSSTTGTWSGVAIDTDPSVKQFREDPAGYIDRHAKALRDGDFDGERRRLLRSSNERIRDRILRLLGVVRKN
jgi:hypothetical protein